MRFSDMVLRSLAARIESMMVIKDDSTSGGTMETNMHQQLRGQQSAANIRPEVLTCHD